LLLLCNALHARESASVFVIDEPEISLNIKWQRQLIDALLKTTDGSPVQFVLATHSIPLLGSYRDCVAELSPVAAEDLVG